MCQDGRNGLGAGPRGPPPSEVCSAPDAQSSAAAAAKPHLPDPAWSPDPGAGPGNPLPWAGPGNLLSWAEPGTPTPRAEAPPARAGLDSSRQPPPPSLTGAPGAVTLEDVATSEPWEWGRLRCGPRDLYGYGGGDLLERALSG